MNAQVAYVTGFGGLEAPIFDRFFIGGEYTIRGFDYRSISPLAQYITQTYRQVTRLDPTGRPVINPLTGTTIVDSVPFYTSYITPVGGDTQVIYNIEYRIPIVGPVTLAPFLDIGRSFILNYSQLKIAPGAVTNLYTIQDGAFVPLKGGEEISVVPGTSMFRASTGLEVQVIMPVVNAPFRLIFAYNPLRLNQIITRPEGGPPVLYQEKSHGVKFSVGRTF